VVTLRRAFVAAWIIAGILGALHLGGPLLLPHLKYGHVMFNKNLRRVSVYEYAGEDGVRRPLAELVATPSLGHARARLGMNAMIKADYLREVCFRATRGGASYTFYTDHYEIEPGARRLAGSEIARCDPHGLVAR
jgi:hypothetical protein